MTYSKAYSAFMLATMAGLGFGLVHCSALLGSDPDTKRGDAPLSAASSDPSASSSASPSAPPAPSLAPSSTDPTAPPVTDAGTAPTSPAGRMVYGIDAYNQLVGFSTAAPSNALSSVKVTGLQPYESLIGIDFRPKDGLLYAVGSTSRLYIVDKMTGAATPVGANAPFAPALDPAGGDFGFDFNPAADRLRIHVETGQNLRINPDTGAHVPGGTGPNGADGTLMFLADDVNAGTTPHLVATGYTNSVRSMPAATTLYAIDSSLDVLVRFDNANAGTMRTVGPLGVDATDIAGFDIYGGMGGGDGAPVINTPLEAYAALQYTYDSSTTSSSGSTGGSYTVQALYRIDLTTGAASALGTLPGTFAGIAVEP